MIANWNGALLGHNYIGHNYVWNWAVARVVRGVVGQLMLLHGSIGSFMALHAPLITNALLQTLALDMRSLKVRVSDRI